MCGEARWAARCAAPTKEEAEICPLIRLAFGQPPSPQGKAYGRVRTPAPTACSEVSCPFVGAGHWPARHIEDGKAARPGGRALQGRTPVVAGGHMGAAPTAEIIPGTLVRQSQAHSLNRTSSNFCKPRAQWPGGNLERHSDFARRKCRTTYQEGVLRNGVRGKRPMDLGGTEWSRSQSDASPGRFGSFAAMGKGTRRPQAAKSPTKKDGGEVLLSKNSKYETRVVLPNEKGCHTIESLF